MLKCACLTFVVLSSSLRPRLATDKKKERENGPVCKTRRVEFCSHSERESTWGPTAPQPVPDLRCTLTAWEVPYGYIRDPQSHFSAGIRGSQGLQGHGQDGIALLLSVGTTWVWVATTRYSTRRRTATVGSKLLGRISGFPYQKAAMIIRAYGHASTETLVATPNPCGSKFIAYLDEPYLSRNETHRLPELPSGPILRYTLRTNRICRFSP